MKYFVTLLFVILSSTIACAQITISADDFIAGFSKIGSAERTSYSISSLTGSGIGMIAKKTGAGLDWDFSPFTFDQETTASLQVMAYPGGAPFANDPDFTTATHVIKVAPKNQGGATIYQFVKIDQNGFFNLGSSSDTLGGKKLLSYIPPLQEYKFPITFQSSWDSYGNWTNTPVAGVLASDSIHVTVDGYGSLTTPIATHQKKGASPMASINDALRITTKKTNTITYGTFSQSVVTYKYEWLTKADHRVIANADKDQKITSFTYSAGTSSSVEEDFSPESSLNLHLSVNPVSNSETRFFYTLKKGGNAQVSIVNMLGNEVSMLHNGPAEAGQNIIPIDPTKFTAGTYFLRVNAEGMSEMRKLIITK